MMKLLFRVNSTFSAIHTQTQTREVLFHNACITAVSVAFNEGA